MKRRRPSQYSGAGEMPDNSLVDGMTGTSAPSGPRAIAQTWAKAIGTKAAAAKFGVSQRTMQRWTTETGKPTNPNRRHREAIDDSQSDGDYTSARMSGMSGRRAARMRNKGATITVSGRMGTATSKRVRQVQVPLDGPAMGRIMAELEAGDTDAAKAAFNEEFGDAYGVAGWEFGDVDVDVGRNR